MNKSIRVILITSALALSAVSLHAQGRGGRGAATPPPPPTDARATLPPLMAPLLSPGQQARLNAMSDELATQTQAVTTARNALAAASLSGAATNPAIATRVQDLAAAELALATARAERFASFQQENQLTQAQINTVIQNGGRGGRGGGGLTPPRSAEDAEGFVSIFDGKTLTNWDGDTQFWRVENGLLVGESTPEKVVQQNSFLIYRGGTVRDFELKFDFRINGTNSGMQYRSQEIEGGGWRLRGYQADLDFPNQYTGQVHDEAGRNIMAPRGQFVRAAGNGVYKLLAVLEDPATIPANLVINGWNTYHIIARGPVLIHIINGRLAAALIDEDPANKDEEGLMGFQMHTGAPFRVEYKNILLRKL